MKRLDAEQYLADVASRIGRTRRPEGATFELTYGCNLRCLHCYNPTHRALPHELTTDEVCALVSQMADMGLLTVTFTGGEPSVRPDIERILRHSRRQGLLIHLLTNATRMTPAFAGMLEEVGVSELFVSIYGATVETYESLTNVPGSFVRFMEGLACLTGRPFFVTVRMPVTTINEHEVDACQALVESKGFKFQYSLDIHPRTDGDTGPLRYRLGAERKAALDRRKLGPRFPAWTPDSCATEEPFISCACGKTRFAVTPYGEMNLCTAFPTPRYDLRTGTVRDGWDVLTRTVDAMRPNEQDHCPTCDLNPFCRQGRADAWLETGDPSRCLPHFKEWAARLRETHALLDPRQPR